MRLHLLFPTVEIADLYLVPMKSYSKNAHDHLSLKWTLVEIYRVAVNESLTAENKK